MEEWWQYNDGKPSTLSSHRLAGRWRWGTVPLEAGLITWEMEAHRACTLHTFLVHPSPSWLYSLWSEHSEGK